MGHVITLFVTTYIRELTHFRRSGANKDHVEGNGKGQYQHYWQQNQLQESDTDIKKHDDRDINERHVFEAEDEVEPGEEHGEGSYLPLPRGGAPALIVKAIDEDEYQSI